MDRRNQGGHSGWEHGCAVRWYVDGSMMVNARGMEKHEHGCTVIRSAESLRLCSRLDIARPYTRARISFMIGSENIRSLDRVSP